MSYLLVEEDVMLGAGAQGPPDAVHVSLENCIMGRSRKGEGRARLKKKGTEGKEETEGT